MKNISKPLLQTIVLGCLTGMRSFSGITAISIMLSANPSRKLKRSSFNYFQNPWVSNTLAVFAAGELVGDKLAWAPNRIELPGLTGRIGCGALTGAVIAKANNQNLLKGALIAGACAAAATFAAFYLRKAAAEKKLLPDFALGVIEDTLVLAAAGTLISRKQKSF